MGYRAIILACTVTLVSIAFSGAGVSRSVAAVPTESQRALHGTLTIFDFSVFEEGPAGRQALATYRRLHPGVTLKILPMPPGDPTVWEESVLAAGTAPDIMVPSYTPQVWNDLPKHVWLNLTPYLSQPNNYITGNTRWIDSMDPTMNKQNAFEGSQYYVVSWSTLDAAFFYNKDIFARVGITHVPATWAELLADSARLKKASYIPDLYFLGDTYPIGENGSFVSLLEAQVMRKTFQRLDTNHDGFVDLKELVYGIKHRIYSPMNPDYQEAWKLYKQWSQYWQPNAAGDKGGINGSEVVANQLFYQGKAAMSYAGQWTATWIDQAKVKFHWGVFRMPTVTTATTPLAGSGDQHLGIWGAWNGDCFAVPVTTKTRGHLALALDFLHFITAPQNEVPATLAFTNFPVVKGWQPRGSFESTLYYLLKHPTMQFAAEATLGPEWLKDRIATQQAYITGQESLSQAMADMQRYTDQAADHVIQIYHLSVQ